MSSADRFARTADKLAALQDGRAEKLARQVREFVQPRGDERVLDVGTGAGALAIALAPLVGEVVAVDPVPEMLAQARRRIPANVELVEADGTALPFGGASFDLVCTLRTLHHVARPELMLSEMTRVTRPAGHMLVVDQLAPADPLAALDLDRFERARDPSHARLLPDIDFRLLFEANGLVLLRERRDAERRDLADYLDRAGCEGAAREHAIALAPPELVAELGWYLLSR